MKKILILLTMFSYLIANDRYDKQEGDCYDFTGLNLLGARAAYFFFTDGTNREVWDNGSIDLEIENNYWFANYYSTFQNINFIFKDGDSTFGTPVRINMATISLGVKEFFPIGQDALIAYLGFGLTCGLVWANNQSQFIPNQDFWASPGIVGKSGLLLIPMCQVVIDLFFDVYYQPIWTSASDSYADMGGFRTGGGICYLF